MPTFDVVLFIALCGGIPGLIVGLCLGYLAGICDPPRVPAPAWDQGDPHGDMPRIPGATL